MIKSGIIFVGVPTDIKKAKQDNFLSIDSA